MTHSSSNNIPSHLSATAPEQCLSPLLHGSVEDFKTQATAPPRNTSSSSSSRRVQFAVPEETFTIDDEWLLHAFSPVPWEPSLQERRLATIGARNAHTLIRNLETSTTIWTSALIAELCHKNDVQDPQGPFKAFVPPRDDAADSRILQYQQAVIDCEKEARGVKRALRGYAAVFDRRHEFEGSNEDTANMIDSRYIFHGEFTASRPKRPRRAYQSPAHDSDEDSPDKENTMPSVPIAKDHLGDNNDISSATQSSYSKHAPGQEPENLPPRGGVVPNAERCTLCDDIPGPKTPHRAEDCRWTT